MKRKIFISINLPEKSKKRLLEATKPWQDMPIKWTKEQNFHLTVSFLGHVSDDSIGEICAKVRDAAKKSEVFDLEFEEILLGPTKEIPQMVWLTGKISEDLRLLQENTEKELGIFVASKKSFRPHITLGRIRKNRWDALEKAPEISAKFPLAISVESVEVMASDFSGDGPEYTVIESCPVS